jgi:hypothetical protein
MVLLPTEIAKVPSLLDEVACPRCRSNRDPRIDSSNASSRVSSRKGSPVGPRILPKIASNRTVHDAASHKGFSDTQKRHRPAKKEPIAPMTKTAATMPARICVASLGDLASAAELADAYRGTRSTGVWVAG